MNAGVYFFFHMIVILEVMPKKEFPNIVMANILALSKLTMVSLVIHVEVKTNTWTMNTNVLVILNTFGHSLLIEVMLEFHNI